MSTYIHHFRHACSILHLNGKKILIDPMLSGKGVYPPVMMTRNPQKNPLVEFPCDYRELFKVDGVIITHMHNDHFDKKAQKELPRDLPILCQSEDRAILEKWGFTSVTGLEKETCWLDLYCQRFIGSHGDGIFKKKLGCSSSFFLQTEKGPSIYLTGDTLLTNKVKKILSNKKTDILLANGGGARLKLGGKITLNHKDILKLSRILPQSTLVAVHMEAMNHCFDRRETLIKMKGDCKILVPEDGELLKL